MFNRDPLANPEPLIRRVYAYVAYFVGDGPDAEERLNPPPGSFLHSRSAERPKCTPDAATAVLPLLPLEAARQPVGRSTTTNDHVVHHGGWKQAMRDDARHAAEPRIECLGITRRPHVVGNHVAIRTRRHIAQLDVLQQPHRAGNAVLQQLERDWSDETIDSLRRVGNHHETICHRGHNLLARMRRTTALDEPPIRCDLVGTIDRQIEAINLGSVLDNEAKRTRRLLSLDRCCNTTNVEFAVGDRGQQEGNSRAGAKPDAHAILDKQCGRLCCDALLRILAHAVTLAAQIAPVYREWEGHTTPTVGIARRTARQSRNSVRAPLQHPP